MEKAQDKHDLTHVEDKSHVEPAHKGRTAVNIVQNPLKKVSAEQATQEANNFAHAHNLSEYADLFGRAALVARSPEHFENLHSVLPPDELEALRYERDHKWHGPKMLWFSIALCAIGAATQGWDQTGSNGANLSFPQEFGIAGEGKDAWLRGLVNSIIFLTAGLVYVCFSFIDPS